MITNLEERVRYIVDKSLELKNKFTDAKEAPIEFACIFCQNQGEYRDLDFLVSKRGGVVQETDMGKIYLLTEGILTEAGLLRLLKVRKPDSQRHEKGDTDFNTNFPEFKARYEHNPRFELVTRDTFEMLRLSDPEYDVMACFSSVPMSKDLGIVLD